MPRIAAAHPVNAASQPTPLDLSSEMSTDIGVSRVYFINLASRTDRLDHMRRQLKGCQWPVERVEAVRLKQDPQKIGYKLLPRLQGQWHVVSIWLSHMKAIESAAGRHEPGAILILEDDVSIRPETWAGKLSFQVNLPNQWEVLFISPRYRKNAQRNVSSSQEGKKWIKAPFGSKPVLLQSVRSSYVCTGAHFCVVRDVETAKTILTTMQQISQVYDVDLFYLSQFRTYGIEDSRVTTAPFGSDHG